MHHDLDPGQRARLDIYLHLAQADSVVNLDAYDLLRVAHWVATGENPDAECDHASDGDAVELDLADHSTDRPISWQPAVN
jgi:hypothetical protein